MANFNVKQLPKPVPRKINALPEMTASERLESKKREAREELAKFEAANQAEVSAPIKINNISKIVSTEA